MSDSTGARTTETRHKFKTYISYCAYKDVVPHYFIDLGFWRDKNLFIVITYDFSLRFQNPTDHFMSQNATFLSQSSEGTLSPHYNGNDNIGSYMVTNSVSSMTSLLLPSRYSPLSRTDPASFPSIHLGQPQSSRSSRPAIATSSPYQHSASPFNWTVDNDGLLSISPYIADNTPIYHDDHEDEGFAELPPLSEPYDHPSTVLVLYVNPFLLPPRATTDNYWLVFDAPRLMNCC